MTDSSSASNFSVIVFIKFFILNFISLKFVQIEAGENYEAAGLVGTSNKGSLFIENCSVEGIIQENCRTGGLVGSAWGNVVMKKCKSYVNVSGRDEVGGIVGLSFWERNRKFNLQSNYNIGTIQGQAI